MLIPLYDDNPVRRISHAYVNWALIAVNVFVYAIFQSGHVLGVKLADATSISFGMIPVVLFHQMDLPAEYVVIPQWLTPVTSSFLHGSWMHLAGNMLFLWVFGDNVEDDLGHVRYFVFYIACAALAALAHAYMQPHSTSPLIGASGAVSGVVAAYALLHPRVKIWVLVLFRIPLKMRAMWAIGVWVLFQAANAYFAGPDDETAWYAHLGGLVSGAVLTLLLKRADAPLFDRGEALIMEAPPSDGEPPP
ncbi:rhomboid family intramembrane serine protease [Labrys wisconsinensis]|uniref:Membrane associated rhomboid family serine protease n=1 Tax=Labrys wisconsinensis TaxID=425677 RepID=A0ABU0JHH4_9HYPH|nr:rhomboid family intramembrane serine protease [Labrys wisconsinensis]MDQ0473719.1 membrane associated rhomboid family serine protease [Labrys wisconsinensis]